LKTIIFKHKPLPLRLEKFLKIYINFKLGSMNILADKQTVQYEKSSSDDEINSIRRSINIINNDENKIQSTLEFEDLNKNKPKANENKTLHSKYLSIEKKTL
jgi:hypothetical protein